MSAAGMTPLDRTGEHNDEAADKLAETLGDFPLALAQAAGYITTADRSRLRVRSG